jgi:hypothetical protein
MLKFEEISCLRCGLLIADTVDPYLHLEPGFGLDQIQAACIACRLEI